MMLGIQISNMVADVLHAQVISAAWEGNRKCIMVHVSVDDDADLLGQLQSLQ